MTTFNFKKEVVAKKPKRWYAMAGNMVHIDSYMWPNDETEALKQLIIDSGFGAWLHTEKLRRTSYGQYRSQKIFLYFQSPLDEARFMLWASGGVQV